MSDWYAPNQQAVGVDPSAGPAPEQEAGKPKSASAYDPSGHTVAAVLQYIEAHPEERDAVLAAEEAGKARVSILGDDG